MLHLVRHGAPAVREGVPSRDWELAPESASDVTALRASGRLPSSAAWYSSPEPKALATARLLHAGPVHVVPALREQQREVTPWFEDPAEWRAVVGSAFAEPHRPALPGWEPLERTRARVVPAVTRLVARHAGEELVLVGHGTAWTVLVAELRGVAAALDRWESMGLPDVLTVELHPDRQGSHLSGPGPSGP